MLKVLDRKERKSFLDMLESQFGFNEKLDYIFFINGKNKIYIANKELSTIDLSKLRINSVGMYIAELRKDVARLSIEGSQLIGPKATKNVVELQDAEAREWMKGKDLDNTWDVQGFVIIKRDGDYLGCGRATKDKILNFVSKARRLNVSD